MAQPLKIPPELARRIQGLRGIVESATEPRACTDYFADHLMEYEPFHQAGAQASHPRLEYMVAFLLQLHRGSPKYHALILFHFPQLHFWHGGVYLEPLTLTNLNPDTCVPMFVLWFEDINRGVFSHSIGGLGSGMIGSSRFSIPDDLDITLDPAKAKIVAISRRTPGGRSN